MDFVIFLTERCNLKCKYCETPETRSKFTQDPSYSNETLKDFLNKAPNVTLQFYGGEPMLNVPLMKYILDNVNYEYTVLQTNGYNVDKLEKEYLDKLMVVSFSIDGRKESTDKWRGKGAYDLVINQANKLREKGYKGKINARMTISYGLDIEKEVKHLLFDANFKFDTVHWQLNALFNESEWKNNKEEIKQWFEKSYNPGILNLIDMWAKEIEENNNILPLVPFKGIMYSFIANQPVNNLRCGAGHAFWAISTGGDIFPCPIMRDDKKFSLGNIKDIQPENIKPKCMLTNKCTDCYIFPLCGGRCLNANLRNEWDDEGFELVCKSIHNLIFGLGNYVNMIKEKIKQGKLEAEDFATHYDYEVIP
jgi:putative peptide-modifying radical SAM enzyme